MKVSSLNNDKSPCEERENSNINFTNHLNNLVKNGDKAYTKGIDEERDKLLKTLKTHIRETYINFNYHKSECIILASKFINFIFQSQDSKPMYYFENKEFPVCWNRPKYWNLDYIKYEWGHLISRNTNDRDIDILENLSLQSGRCNNQIQSVLNTEDLLIYGGKLAERITKVLDNRKKLFNSKEWKDFKKEMENYK